VAWVAPLSKGGVTVAITLSELLQMVTVTVLIIRLVIDLTKKK
jgi:hypothetical protein